MTTLSCGDLDPVEIDLFIGSTPCPTGYVVDFGLCDIEYGDTIEKTITVKSAGTSDLIISSVKLSGTGAESFSLAQDDYSGMLGAQRSMDIDVFFYPTELGAHTCTLEIESSDVSEPLYTITLKGMGAKTIYFNSLAATNGTSDLVTTSKLTLEFDQDPIGLLISDITIVGATPVSLSDSGSTRELDISDVIVANEQEITLSLGTASGYIFNPSSLSTIVYKNKDYISPNIGTMKYVPAGKFQRDGTASNISSVSAFRIGRTEVTRSQFEAVMGYDPSWNFASANNVPDNPVQMMFWYDAIAFCNKLSIIEGLTPVYSVTGISDWSNISRVEILDDTIDWDGASASWIANGYRLPTEMEWMWAAMGAPADGQGLDPNTTGYLKDYAGDDGTNTIDDCAWYDKDMTDDFPHPVGLKDPNELDICDMSGNIYEWCWDWYGTITSGEKSDYTGATSGSQRVLRGGCFEYTEGYCSVNERYFTEPGGGEPHMIVGFRVVRK